MDTEILESEEAQTPSETLSESDYGISADSDSDEQFRLVHGILDTEPLLNEELCARFRFSYAYITFRERSPKMLKEMAECLCENKHRLIEDYGDYVPYDIRRICWSLDILREEILSNKPFNLFHDKGEDVEEWNEFILGLSEERNQWFSAVWLSAECYLYRRLYAIFKRTDTLCNYDYFGQQKICATRNVIYVMLGVLKATRSLRRNRKNFKLVLKLSLWANRCDLSNTKEPPDERIVQLIKTYNDDLLVDESNEAWWVLTQTYWEPEAHVFVDIVLDNAGYEIFADLILAEYLIETGLARKVRFHVKAMPWFVSDVTEKDFRWMLRFFRKHEIPEMAAFGKKLHGFMRDHTIELCSVSHFWTSPYGCSRMREKQPCLYVKLSEATLVIFKGDLNYRKLLGDIFNDPTTPFVECLRGFLPSSICSLRAIKSDIYCGLPICAVEWETERKPGWMFTGEKGVIQVAVKPR